MRKSPREYFGVQSNKRGKHTLWGGGYEPGNHWVECEVCGCDIRAFDIKLRWDGLRVCPDDWETRHPQDFVRGRHDDIRAKEPVRSSSLSTADLERAIDTGSLGGDSVDDDLICRLVYDYSRISTPNIAVPNLAVPNVEDPTVTEVCTPNPNNPPTSNIPDPTFGGGPTTPDPVDPPPPPPPPPVTGAEASNLSFPFPGITVFTSSLSIFNNRFYVQDSNTLRRYSDGGILLDTNQIPSSGVIVSITPSNQGDFIVLEDVSTFQNPQFRFRRMAAEPPYTLGATIGQNITTGTGPSLDIALDDDQNIYLVSNVDDSIRQFSPTGTLITTLNIGAQGQNPASICHVEGNFWVTEQNSDIVHEYNITTGPTGNTFNAVGLSTFGLFFDGDNFWEGDEFDDRVHRRPAIRTTQ